MTIQRAWTWAVARKRVLVLIASGAKEKADRVAQEQNLTREQKLEVLTKENIKLQIKHLHNISFIKNRRANGGLLLLESAGLTPNFPGRAKTRWG